MNYFLICRFSYFLDHYQLQTLRIPNLLHLSPLNLNLSPLNLNLLNLFLPKLLNLLNLPKLLNLLD
jgi:hypothetical protein